MACTYEATIIIVQFLYYSDTILLLYKRCRKKKKIERVPDTTNFRYIQYMVHVAAILCMLPLYIHNTEPSLLRHSGVCCISKSSEHIKFWCSVQRQIVVSNIINISCQHNYARSTGQTTRDTGNRCTLTHKGRYIQGSVMCTLCIKKHHSE